ncbi:hypothetical protein EVAR_83905_1 [Eumeta japonica]|uniref:Uncharacterized protein n=1 Tax=Eumeta variegata TaxID=151549 RepID=A0A4C1URC4_EUMVA|nr:hypothetical protein EVAR_83905_1 [Eumeta japonica]
MRIESGTGIEGGIRIGTCSNRDRLRNSASNWHREQDLHRNRERDSDHDHDSDRNRTIYKNVYTNKETNYSNAMNSCFLKSQLVFQVRASTDRVVNTLFVLLSTVSALSKQLTFNLRTARVDALVEFINDTVTADGQAIWRHEFPLNTRTLGAWLLWEMCVPNRQKGPIGRAPPPGQVSGRHCSTH